MYRFSYKFVFFKDIKVSSSVLPLMTVVESWLWKCFTRTLGKLSQIGYISWWTHLYTVIWLVFKKFTLFDPCKTFHNKRNLKLKAPKNVNISSYCNYNTAHFFNCFDFVIEQKSQKTVWYYGRNLKTKITFWGNEHLS